MLQRKVIMYETSVVAFRRLQVSFLNKGFYIVSLDPLYQIIYVKKKGSFPSKILTFKIKILGIGNKSTAIIQTEGYMAILFSLWRHHIERLLSELEECIKNSI